jgi:hypothetical protein
MRGFKPPFSAVEDISIPYVNNSMFGHNTIQK